LQSVAAPKIDAKFGNLRAAVAFQQNTMTIFSARQAPATAFLVKIGQMKQVGLAIWCLSTHGTG
jgi:hypothetical protein